MNNDAGIFAEGDEDILGVDASDAALEAAASPTIRGAAFSFPNAPTVSVLFTCCGNDDAELDGA